MDKSDATFKNFTFMLISFLKVRLVVTQMNFLFEELLVTWPRESKEKTLMKGYLSIQKFPVN